MVCGAGLSDHIGKELVVAGHRQAQLFGDSAFFRCGPGPRARFEVEDRSFLLSEVIRRAASSGDWFGGIVIRHPLTIR